MRTLKFSTSVAVAALLVAGCVTSEGNVRPLVRGPWNAGSDSASLYEIGKQHLAAKRYGLAIVHFDRMLAQEPKSVIGLNAIAAAYDQLGRFDASERYYKKAMRQDPNSRQTLNNIGYSYLLQKKFDLAQRYLAMADQRLGEVGEVAEIVATNRALAESETTPEQARASLNRWEIDEDKPATRDKSLLLAEALTKPPAPKAKVRVMRSGERDYKLFTRGVSETPVKARPAVWRVMNKPAVDSNTTKNPVRNEVAKASQVRVQKRLNLSARLSYLIPDATLAAAQPQSVPSAAVETKIVAAPPAAQTSSPPAKLTETRMAALSGPAVPVSRPTPAMPKATAALLVPAGAPAHTGSLSAAIVIKPAPAVPAPGPSARLTEVKMAKLAPMTPLPVISGAELKVTEPVPIAPGPVVLITEVKVAKLDPLTPAAPAPEVKIAMPAPVPSVPVTEVKVAKLSPLTPPPAAPVAEVKVATPEPVAPGPIVPLTEVEVAKLAPLAQPTASPNPKITVAELEPLAPIYEAPARAAIDTEAQPEMPVVAAPVAIEVAAIFPASTILAAGGHAVRQIQGAGKALAALLIPRKPHAAIESNRPEVLDNRNPVIEVSNGAGRRAMAARVREYLRNYGEHPQRLTNAKSFYHAKTVVLFKPGFEDKARSVADLMPGEIETRTDSSLGRSDVRLRLGRDLIELDQQLYFSGLEI